MSEEIRTEEKTEVKNNVKPRKSKGKKALKILAVIICAFILLGLLASLVSAIGNKANLGKAISSWFRKRTRTATGSSLPTEISKFFRLPMFISAAAGCAPKRIQWLSTLLLR